MLRREFWSHFLITLVWLVLISLLRWDWQLNLVWLWLGGLVGTFIVDLDHLIYVWAAYPSELTSLRVRHLWQQGQSWAAFNLLVETHEERIKLQFHNVVFQTFFFVVCFFVLTSSGSLFGAGLVMAGALHLLKDELDFVFGKKADMLAHWFWPIKKEFTLKQQKFYALAMLLVFLVLNLLLV